MRKTGCGEHVDGENDVAGPAAEMGGLALPAQPDLLAALDAGRNVDVEHAAGGQRDAHLAALHRLLQRHGDGGGEVLALLGACGPAPRPPAAHGAAEKVGENVAGVEACAAAAPGRPAHVEFEVLPAPAGPAPAPAPAPPGRPAPPKPSKPVKRGLPSASISPRSNFRALLGVAEDFIGRNWPRRTFPWPWGRTCSGRDDASWPACDRPS